VEDKLQVPRSIRTPVAVGTIQFSTRLFSDSRYFDLNQIARACQPRHLEG